jgi:hypothetical protein
MFKKLFIGLAPLLAIAAFALTAAPASAAHTKGLLGESLAAATRPSGGVFGGDLSMASPGPAAPAASEPVVNQLVPENGPNAGGTSVEIIGVNFNEVEAVKFGSTNVSFTRNSETSITAVSPPFSGGSARVLVSVTTRGGVSPERHGTVLGPEFFGYAPTVTVVSPKSDAGGTRVTIQGKAFESIRGPDEFPFVSAVKFGSTNATSFEVHPVGGEAYITAVAPAGTGTVDVTVETLAGTSATGPADRYTFIPPPTVVTGTASAITNSSTTLNASVNPNGGEVGGCKFEYGTTSAYGSSAPCTPSLGPGESPVAVAASVSGLSPSTTYHFRISATNAGGTSSGSDQTFVPSLLPGPTFATSFTPESEGSFNGPDAVALDPSGNIWVADSGHDRVLEFNKERKFLRQFGVVGTGVGQYEGIAVSGIAGIATNSSGDVYVTGSDRVQEFSPTGEFLRQWGSPGSGNGQFLFPYGIAADGSGNVWVLDTFNYRVQEFSESGAFLKAFGSKGTENGQLGWASGLAFSGGNLYVADSSRVEEFSTAGAYLAQFGSSGAGNGQFHGLGGIASDPTTGDLYVSDTYDNRVQVFSSAGAFITAFGSGGSGNGQFSGPRGVAVNSSGTAYVADTANNRVQEWVGGP